MVNESMDSVRVCIVITGERERNVSVFLVTNEGTAEGLESIVFQLSMLYTFLLYLQKWKISCQNHS